MIIPRLLARKLVDSVTKFPIVSLTEPRQSGKTTLLRHLLPNYTSVSLENPIGRISTPGRYVKNRQSRMPIAAKRPKFFRIAIGLVCVARPNNAVYFRNGFQGVG